MRSVRVIGRRTAVVVATFVILLTTAPLALAAAGDPDTRFGTDGKVAVSLSRSGTAANAVVIQTDGRIIAVGTAGTASDHPKFAVVRFKADGTRDSTFGNDGGITTTVSRSGGYARAAAIQPDGKIVVAGATKGVGERFALVRYNRDGTLDTSFGRGGLVKTSFDRDAGGSAVVLQTDGRIIVGGTLGGNDGFALARYNADGTLDSGFGGDGKVTTENQFRLSALAVQSDGKIVAAGSLFYPVLTRYNPDGTLDPTFGEMGEVVTYFDAQFLTAYDVAIDAEGKIVTAGGIKECGTFAECWKSFLLTRYDGTGTLDSTFGMGGIVGPVATAEAFRTAYAVAIQTDGKIVAAGVSGGSDSGFALVRYNSDGTFDPTFGKHGRVLTNITRFADRARAVAIQEDGSIVVAGGIGISGPNPKLALARYLAG